MSHSISCAGRGMGPKRAAVGLCVVRPSLFNKFQQQTVISGSHDGSEEADCTVSETQY